MTATPDSFVYQDPGPARALRARLRQLMRRHLEPNWLGPFTNDPADLELSNRFCEVLADEGLLVPNWPSRYGGRDLDLASSIVIREEMWAHFEPRGAQYYGPNWVGPSIFDYGTEEQKALHLPLISSGKAIWCQGFSEPDAGSDLANLSTRAVPDGDGFRITGQKIWTSWALWAQWCYLLARIEGTSPGSRDGITVFLIPMSRDGITVRGLDGIPGPHHLNEVFLDGVWAERSEVLGEVGNGWQVIRDALSNERVGIARYARDDRLIAQIATDPIRNGRVPASRWMETRLRNRMARLMCRRALWFQEDGGSHDFIVSAARMVTTRANLFTADTLSEALADEFFDDRYSEHAPAGGAVEFFWRYMQAGTIASGTTEMLQRQLSRAIFRGERLRVSEGTAEVRTIFDRLLEDLGGVDAARRAVKDPPTRSALIPPVDTFVESLDPRAGFEEGMAAAEICRSAGSNVLALPIEGMLLRRAPDCPLALLSSHKRLEHGDLFGSWLVTDRSGRTMRSGPASQRVGSKVGPFVTECSPKADASAEHLTDLEHSLLHVLPSWYIVGALERALDLAAVYATERVTFGSPISKYQGVAFPLADAYSEVVALHELALYTLHSAYHTPASALVDALGLRYVAIDMARRTLRTAHQVLGAVGLCDEHDLSVITLTLQARLRLPMNSSETMASLATEVDQHGFDCLFQPADFA